MTQAENSKFVPALPDDDTSVKVYEGVAECTMNDADTIKNVKSRAKDLAQENLLKTIADYVDRFLKERLLTFPDDEILSVAEEIYHITDVKYNVFDSDDDMMIRATVTAQVDDNDIMNCLVRFFKERTELKRQVEELKRQIEKLIEPAKQKYDNALVLFHKNDYAGAINLFDEAIQLNPNYANSYYYRGWSYRKIGNEQKAQEGFAKAEELRKKS